MRGNPTPEEVAALVAVLAAVGGSSVTGGDPSARAAGRRRPRGSGHPHTEREPAAGAPRPCRAEPDSVGRRRTAATGQDPPIEPAPGGRRKRLTELPEMLVSSRRCGHAAMIGLRRPMTKNDAPGIRDEPTRNARQATRVRRPAVPGDPVGVADVPAAHVVVVALDRVDAGGVRSGDDADVVDAALDVAAAPVEEHDVAALDPRDVDVPAPCWRNLAAWRSSARSHRRRSPPARCPSARPSR